MFETPQREKDRAVKNLDRLKAIHKRLLVLGDEVFEKRLKLLEANALDMVAAEKIHEEDNYVSRQRIHVVSDIRMALQELQDKKDKRKGDRRKESVRVEYDDDDSE